MDEMNIDGRHSRERLPTELHQRCRCRRGDGVLRQLSVPHDDGLRAAVRARRARWNGCITLNVNGQNRPVDVMKQETLAMTLRYKLGLTGTKLGCDRAECGACTVLIDDVPHYSCSILTHSVRGQEGR